MKASAFTLIELVAVLLLIGILSAAVSLSLAGKLHNARMEDVLAQVSQYDQLTRQYCQRQGKPLQVVFDLDHGEVTRSSGQSSQTWQMTRCELPEGFAIAAMAVGPQPASSGKVAIWCSDRGFTPSYALKITGPTGAKWLIVSGLTGMVVQKEDEREVREILALCGAGGKGL